MADISVGNLIVGIKAQMTEFKNQMNQAGKSFNKLTGTIEKNKVAIQKTAVAFGAAGAAIGAAFIVAIKSTATFADNIEKMSARTGVASKDLSALSFIAGRAGTNIGSLENAIKRLQRNMSDAAQGIGEARRAFEFLDIEVMNNDGSLKGVIEIMSEFAEKTKDMTDASKKGALAQELFGRAGTTLLPLFRDGAEGMALLASEADRYGIILDEVAAKQGADFVDAILNAQSAIQGLKIAIVEDMVPPLTDLINKFADAAANVKDFARENERLVKTIPKLALAFAGLATVISLVMVGGLGLLAFQASIVSLITILPKVVLGIKSLTLALATSTGGLGFVIAAVGTALGIMFIEWIAFSDEVKDDKVPLINVFEELTNESSELGSSFGINKIRFRDMAAAMRSTITGNLVPAINEVTGAMQSTNEFVEKVDESFDDFIETFREGKLSEEVTDVKNAFVNFQFKPLRENPFAPFEFDKFDFFGGTSRAGFPAELGRSKFINDKRDIFESFNFKPLKGNPFGLFGFDEFDFFGGTERAGFPAELGLGMFIKNKSDAFLGFKFKEPLKNPFADFRASFEEGIFGDTDLARQFRQIATPLQNETALLLKNLGLRWDLYINGVVGGRPGLPGGAGDSLLDDLADRYGIHLTSIEQETFDFLVARDAVLPGQWQTFVDGIINVRLADLKNRYPEHFSDIQLLTAGALEDISDTEWQNYVDSIVDPRDSKMAELRDKYEDRMSDVENDTADALLEETGSIGIWEEYARRVTDKDTGIMAAFMNFFGEDGADIVGQTQRALENSADEFNKALVEGGSFNKAFNNLSKAFRDSFTTAIGQILTEIEVKLIKEIIKAVTGIGFIKTVTEKISGVFTDIITTIIGKQVKDIDIVTPGGVPGGGGGDGDGGGEPPIVPVGEQIGTVVALILAARKLSDLLSDISGTQGTDKKYRQFAEMIEDYLIANPRRDPSLVQINNLILDMMQRFVQRGGFDSNQKVFDFFRISRQRWPLVSDETEKAALPTFQRGGVVPGFFGQPRMIMAHSGEEVVRRDDPRHVSNIGQGMMVNITGNNINSELDMRRLARMAGDEIMSKLRTKVSVPI